MDSLQFNVAQLLKEGIGATRTYAVEVDIAGLDPGLPATRPLQGEVSFLRTNRGILAQGTLTTEVALECSRCLAIVRQPLQCALEEEFFPTISIITGRRIVVEEEDPALRIDEHHVLDLTEVVRQGLLLDVPLRVVCPEGTNPDCQMVASDDSPDADVTINADPVDDRWAKLLRLRQS